MRGAHAYANANSDTNCDAHSHAHGNGNTDRNRNSYSDPDRDCNTHTHGDSHAEAYTHAEAASDAGAADKHHEIKTVVDVLAAVGDERGLRTVAVTTADSRTIIRRRVGRARSPLLRFFVIHVDGAHGVTPPIATLLA
jgi:hypothetical protein